MLVAQLKQAMNAIDAGGKFRLNQTTNKPKQALTMPEDFANALAKNAAAKKHFAAFTPGKQRDYLEWIIEAKQEATRLKRTDQAVEWIAEGKSRNWKYEKR